MNKLVIFSVTCTGMVLASQFAWEIVHAQDAEKATDDYELPSRSYKPAATPLSGSLEADGSSDGYADTPGARPQTTGVAGGNAASRGSAGSDGYSDAGGDSSGVVGYDQGSAFGGGEGGGSPADRPGFGSGGMAPGGSGGGGSSTMRQAQSGGFGMSTMDSGFGSQQRFKKRMATRIITLDGNHQAKEIEQIISQMFPISHYDPVFTSSDSVTNSVIVKTDAEMMKMVEELIVQLTSSTKKLSVRWDRRANGTSMSGVPTAGAGRPRVSNNPFGTDSGAADMGAPGMSAGGMGAPGMMPMKPTSPFAKAGQLEQESLRSVIELQNLIIKHGEQHPKTRDIRNRVRQHLETLHQVRITAQREELERIRARLEMVESRLKLRESMSKQIIEKRMNELLSSPNDGGDAPGQISDDPFGAGEDEADSPNPLRKPSAAQPPVIPPGTPRTRNASGPASPQQSDAFDSSDSTTPPSGTNSGEPKKSPSPFDS